MSQDFANVDDEQRHEAAVGEIPPDKLLIDIGQKTIARYVKIIHEADTVFMNGPMGVIEKKPGEVGAKAIWEAVTFR